MTAKVRIDTKLLKKMSSYQRVKTIDQNAFRKQINKSTFVMHNFKPIIKGNLVL
jgi:hypothetical protein